MSSMHYKGYTARIEFDEADGIFWGKVLGLPNHTSISTSDPTDASNSASVRWGRGCFCGQAVV